MERASRPAWMSVRACVLPATARRAFAAGDEFAEIETVKANVSLFSPIGGTVVELAVKEGDGVKQGQIVATIGDEKLALQMKSLDAQIAGLEAQLVRLVRNAGRILLREARAAAALNHPNLVQVYSAGESDGLHWFAMEFVHGESAYTRLKRKGCVEAGSGQSTHCCEE